MVLAGLETLTTGPPALGGRVVSGSVGCACCGALSPREGVGRSTLRPRGTTGVDVQIGGREGMPLVITAAAGVVAALGGRDGVPGRGVPCVLVEGEGSRLVPEQVERGGSLWSGRTVLG